MYRNILFGGLTAAAILGAGTAALATTGSESTNVSPASSTASSSSAHATTRRSPLARAAHAQITVKTKKGYVTRDLIRGTVTAVTATSITVQAGDKTSETFVVATSTKVVTRAQTKGAKPTPSSIDKVSKDQHVLVSGTGTSTLTAGRIVVLRV